MAAYGIFSLTNSKVLSVGSGVLMGGVLLFGFFPSGAAWPF